MLSLKIFGKGYLVDVTKDIPLLFVIRDVVHSLMQEDAGCGLGAILSTIPPTGASEPAAPIIGPALANSMSTVTGRLCQTLPLRAA